MAVACPQCGIESPATAAFCASCGAKLSSVEALAAPTAREKFAQVATRRQGRDEPEQELWQGTFSHKAMIGSWISAAVATFAALVLAALGTFGAGSWMWLLGLVLLVWAGLVLRYFYHRFSVHYFLTNQRFMNEQGLLWRTINRLDLIDIDDVSFTQGPVERMLNVGTITLTSSDKTDPLIHLPGIDRVREVAGIISDQQRKERMRRGLHIESV